MDTHFMIKTKQVGGNKWKQEEMCTYAEWENVDALVEILNKVLGLRREYMGSNLKGN